MKNKLRNAKQFVQNHSHKITTTLGFAAGAGGTFLVMRNPHTTMVLDLTLDQAKTLVEDPTKLVQFDAPNVTAILNVIP